MICTSVCPIAIITNCEKSNENVDCDVGRATVAMAIMVDG